MADAPGPVTDYDLYAWRRDRERELLAGPAREGDRLLRLINHLTVARWVLSLRDQEVERLKAQLRFAVACQSKRLSEVKRLQTQLLSSGEKSVKAGKAAGKAGRKRVGGRP